MPRLGSSELAMLFFLVFGTIFWIWMLWDLVTQENIDGNQKVIWILVVALTHFIGAFIYFVMKKTQHIKTNG